MLAKCKTGGASKFLSCTTLSLTIAIVLGVFLVLGCGQSAKSDFSLCVDDLKIGDSESEVKRKCGEPSLTSQQEGGRVKYSYLRGPMDMKSDGLDVFFENGTLVESKYFDPVSGKRQNLPVQP
jgi:hypothetical protein